MTYNQNPGPYGQPYGQQPPIVPGQPQAYGPPVSGQPYAPPPPPSKRSWGPGKILLVVFGAVAAFCLVSGVIAAAISSGKSSTPGSGSAVKAVSTGGGQDTGQPADPPKASGTPKASDFKLTAKITSKQCFGSAGCNVTYKVDLAYSGPTLDDGDTWQVTYEATGDESGPITNQIEVNGTRYSSEEQSISTPDEGTPIKIKVTDVEKQ